MPTAWKQWIPAVLWLGLIGVQSTDLLSSAHSGRFLYYWIVRCFGAINPVRFELWHHYLRKAGHVVGYAMLSYLLFRAWRATFPLPRTLCWSIRWARTAFFTTVLVASLDEWHQAVLPSRTGNLKDVVLDSTAAALALGLVWLFLRRRSAGIKL